jgi:hypothetical protein
MSTVVFNAFIFFYLVGDGSTTDSAEQKVAGLPFPLSMFMLAIIRSGSAVPVLATVAF